MLVGDVHFTHGFANVLIRKTHYVTKPTSIVVGIFYRSHNLPVSSNVVGFVFNLIKLEMAPEERLTNM